MICPHCEGTGWAGSAIKPIPNVQGKRLSPREGEIVAILKEAKGACVMTSRICVQLGETAHPKLVHVYIHRIRTKLPGLIQTHHWHGYSINMEALEDA